MKQITKETKLKAKIELPLLGFHVRLWCDHPACNASFCRLEWKGKEEALSKPRDPIEVAEARISGPIVKLVFQVGATVY